MRPKSNTAEKLEELRVEKTSDRTEDFDIASDIQISSLIKQFGGFSLFGTLENTEKKKQYDIS